MSVGVFTSPVMLENVTHSIFHGFGAVNNGGIIGAGGGIGSGGIATSAGGYVPSQGKHCVDINERLISPGMHFVPGPDECTLCACDDGEPKWCKAVYCAPPQDCKSFRVGKSCCDFICMDDGGPNTGGPYLSRPVEIANFVPKVVIAAVTAMLSLSLLFFLIHRLRQRHIQGRLNSARARRSTQMCDECDDTRSLDFSNDFFEHRMNSPHLYPPQYLAWWKPPSSYFPPRGEAPPPYEEAMTTTTTTLSGTSIVTTHTANNNSGGGGTTTLLPPYGHNNNLQSNHNSSNGGTHGGAINPAAANGTAAIILNDIPIIVPPPVLPPGPPQPTSGGMGGARSSPAAVQRLASAIANTTNSGGSTTCCGVVTTVNNPLSLAISASSPRHSHHHHHHRESSGGGGKVCQVFKIKSSSSSASKSSGRSKKDKDGSNSRRNSRSRGGDNPVELSNHQDSPQPGTSRIEETDLSNSGPSPSEELTNLTRYQMGLSPRPFRLGSHYHHHLITPPQPNHGPAPPTYEDAIYSLHPAHPPTSLALAAAAAASGSSPSSFYHRHSLTLPPRRYLDDHTASLIGGEGGLMSESHLYPHVIVHGSSGLISAPHHHQGPHTCYTEEELLRRAHNHQNHQRYSLQFNVGGSCRGNESGILGGETGIATNSHPNGRRRGETGDWSSSSSTLSLSTSPNSPVDQGRGSNQSLSSSSESSASENPPPPPAPTSAPPGPASSSSSSSSSSNCNSNTARA